jgi:hypothetical protein
MLRSTALLRRQEVLQQHSLGKGNGTSGEGEGKKLMTALRAGTHAVISWAACVVWVEGSLARLALASVTTLPCMSTKRFL